MAEWTKEELEAIAKDENLYISIPNQDGTMHKPTWIWIAQAGNELFTRGYNGTQSRWYVSAKAVGHGHISSGGVEKDVTFEFPIDKETNDLIDAGYAEKYGKYRGSYLDMMLGEKQKTATVKLIPKD